MSDLRSLVFANDISGLSEALLKAPDQVNKQEPHGRSALMEAVINNKKEFVDILLAHGADPNIQDGQGFAALHFAAQSGFVEVAKALLAQGADVNIKNIHGNSPLNISVFNVGRIGISMSELLFNNGADPDQENKSGVSSRSLAETIGAADVSKLFKS